MNHLQRAGNFTSSEIYNLIPMGKREMTEEELKMRPKSGKGSSAKLCDDPNTFLAGGMTYISEKNMERRLGRSLNTDADSRPTSWGNLLEMRVLEELLGLEYKPMSTETTAHISIPFWAGSPDAVKYDEERTVAEIKCPYTLKSFCTFADCKTIDEIREKHPDGEKYYWQIISNAILTDSKYAELIVYCPYKSELNLIRELTQTLDTDEQSRHSWIYWSNDDELPFLPDGGYYRNLHIIRFEVPENDKNLLIGRVLQAGNLLVERLEVIQEAA